jgi:hypothetical protein
VSTRDDIPDTTFRLEHGFAIKPDLSVDGGPRGGVTIGRHSSSESQAIYIGKHAETPYRGVWVDTVGAHAFYVMGKRRSGKSHTLAVIAEGLIGNGWTNQGGLQQGVLILDSMNVFLTMPFAVRDTVPDGDLAAREVKKWRLESEGIAAIEAFRPRGTAAPAALQSREISLRPSDLSSDEWCGLFEADPFADPLGHLLTELYAKVASDGYTDSRTGTPVPSNPDFGLNDLLQALDADPNLLNYPRDTRESLRRRLDTVRRLPVFSERGLDVRELIQPGKISIVLLRDLDQQMRTVLVALIVKRIMQLRGVSEQEERMMALHLARAQKFKDSPNEAEREKELADECRARAAGGLPRAWILIDEAHNYIPAKGVVASRRPLKRYVDEGRNLGLSIVVATQQPASLDPSIQRNADLLLIHSLSHRDDIEAAEGMINTAPPSEVVLDNRDKIQGAKSFETLVRSLPQGYALAATDRANRLFPVRIRPRISVHGGTDY